LALWQAHHVAARLTASGDLEVELVTVSTEGDRRRDVSLSELGGKGVFVKEVQAAVLDGRADLAVHSAKDLPAVTVDGLVVGAVPERGDPRDALAGAPLGALADGATVATGSKRRSVQLLDARPDLRIVDLRGNIDTRLAKIGEVDAVVVAVAALERLDRTDAIAEALDVDVMLPQVGQGALAIECRSDDDETRARLSAIEDPPSRVRFDAERAFLAGQTRWRTR
jgi:hydroxymethylbilane synthase